MKKKEQEGFVAMDMVLAIVTIMAFSVLMVSLMYSNSLENIKIKREALATIYLTETLENVGIANYSEVLEENTDLIPLEAEEKKFDIRLKIEDQSEELEDSQNQDKIIKEVTATISYKVGKKNYTLSMERIKIKE